MDTNRYAVREVAYGWIVTRDGHPAEYTLRHTIKHYRSAEAADKAKRRLEKAQS